MRTPDPEHEAWLADALARYAASRDAGRPDTRLRDDIIERSLWLAQRAARRYSDRGEPLDDLVQVANLGLLKAVERFDPSNGTPFGAYATPTIMGELRRHFRDHTWSVHVPRRARDVVPTVKGVIDQLSKELGRSPKVAEIAAHLEMSEDDVLEALEASAAYKARSFDPAIHDHHPSSPDDALAVLDRELVGELLEQLAPRERKILYLRFFEEQSQSQIAEQIGTSQVHVGRLIASSLARLRDLLDAS